MNLGAKMNICNKKYKAILLISFSVVLRSFAQSGETVTLTIDEAVDYARAHSRTLKSADIDLEIAKRAFDNAWNVFLPDVRATGTLSRTTDISSSLEQQNTLLRFFGRPPVSETEKLGVLPDLDDMESLVPDIPESDSSGGAENSGGDYVPAAQKRKSVPAGETDAETMAKAISTLLTREKN